MHKKILIVCTGNTCRSAMAAALLKKMLKEELGEKASQITIWSAGLTAWPGSPASPEAVEIMRREGINLSSHRARKLTKKDVLEADLVFTMTLSQKDAVLALAPEAKGKVFALRELMSANGDPEQRWEKLRKLRIKVAEKRQAYLEKEGPKMAELHARYQELSAQLRSLEDELRKIEEKLRKETEEEEKELLKLEKELARIDIPDPYGQNLSVYEECAFFIKEALQELVNKIKEELEK